MRFSTPFLLLAIGFLSPYRPKLKSKVASKRCLHLVFFHLTDAKQILRIACKTRLQLVFYRLINQREKHTH